MFNYFSPELLVEILFFFCLDITVRFFIKNIGFISRLLNKLVVYRKHVFPIRKLCSVNYFERFIAICYKSSFTMCSSIYMKWKLISTPLALQFYNWISFALISRESIYNASIKIMNSKNSSQTDINESYKSDYSFQLIIHFVFCSDCY